MNNSDHTGIPAPPTERTVDPDLAIAALRESGAERFDPVRFHYIVTLATRALAHHGEVRRILQGKLAEALADYRERFEQARNDAHETLTRLSESDPEMADELQQLFIAGDFRKIQRIIDDRKQQEQRASLAGLARDLAQHLPESTEGRPEGNFRPRSDLKTIRYFRNTWAKLSVDKKLRQAFEQGPENAGPLNSHRLVLRSLSLMRQISPDYLNRFVSYIDTLLWLDQAGKTSKPMEQNTPRRKRLKQ